LAKIRRFQIIPALGLQSLEEGIAGLCRAPSAAGDDDFAAKAGGGEAFVDDATEARGGLDGWQAMCRRAS
jgi:hypothetical protein